MIPSASVALLTTALTTVVLQASAQQNAEIPVFRSEANLVVLHVNVFDDNGHPVPELSAENFLVVEDGRPQAIRFFSGEDVPVTVGLVIDNSSSMITRRSMVVAGGLAFASSSHPEDELFTVSVTERVRLGLPPQIAFTGSRSMLQAALHSLRPGGKTALHDAVIYALDHIQQAKHQKRVIIVLSDGDDTASTHSEKEMLVRAQASDVIIYTIGVIDLAAVSGSGSRGVLRDLARIGGGMAYFPDRDSEVVKDFEEIAASIRQGYSIGYVPTNLAPNAGFRRVKLTVRASGRHGLTARYRHGYVTPELSSAER